MKYIFLGSGAIAAQCLEITLKEQKNSVIHLAGLVGDQAILDMFPNDLCAARILIDREHRNEHLLVDMLRKVSPFFVISVQYPWIISADVLQMLRGRFFNIHNAKLPDYRGHGALTYEILNNDLIHTSTLHIMDVIVDRGVRVRESFVSIAPDETAISLWHKSASACADLFRWLVIEENIRHVDKYSELIVGDGVYYKRSQILADKNVPPNSDFDTLCRYARAFHFPPHEPAFFVSGGSKIYLIPQQAGSLEVSVDLMS